MKHRIQMFSMLLTFVLAFPGILSAQNWRPGGKEITGTVVDSKTDTGAKSGDERKTTFEAKLNGVLYPNLYVTDPASEGWDSLLASKAVGG